MISHVVYCFELHQRVILDKKGNWPTRCFKTILRTLVFWIYFKAKIFCYALVWTQHVSGYLVYACTVHRFYCIKLKRVGRFAGFKGITLWTWGAKRPIEHTDWNGTLKFLGKGGQKWQFSANLGGDRYHFAVFNQFSWSIWNCELKTNATGLWARKSAFYKYFIY